MKRVTAGRPRPPVPPRSPLSVMRAAHPSASARGYALLRLSARVVTTSLTDAWEAHGKV